jgi:hypothetical protein
MALAQARPSTHGYATRVLQALRPVLGLCAGAFFSGTPAAEPADQLHARRASRRVSPIDQRNQPCRSIGACMLVGGWVGGLTVDCVAATCHPRARNRIHRCIHATCSSSWPRGSAGSPPSTRRRTSSCSNPLRMRGSSQPGANAVSAAGHDVHRLLAIKEYEKRKGRRDKGAPVGAASDPEPIEICNVMKFFHVDLYAAAVAWFLATCSDGCLHPVRRSSTTWSTL